MMIINAKFKSICAKCGKIVEKNTEVAWDKENSKIYCMDCYNNNDTKVPTKNSTTPNIEIDIKALKKKVSDTVDKTVDERLKLKKNSISKTTDDEIKAAKQRIIDDLTHEFGAIPRRIIKLDRPDRPIKTISDLTHEKFEDIITIVNADVPVFLRGDAGCGKNYMVKQIADALELEFFFSNAITNEYKITGFIDANGHFHETQFYEAFTKGGLFFFDEIDASIPEVLVLLNAAIENKYFNFPTGRVSAHPNFRIIAAGNTFGNGANSTYVGRYQLDGASLDRFAVIDITYDTNVELQISNNNRELVDAIHTLRSITLENGIKVILSYRVISQITKMEKSLKLEDIMKYTVLKGMHIDDINIIRPKIEKSTNKYLVALTAVMK